jgi:small GTP-binding protein
MENIPDDFKITVLEEDNNHFDLSFKIIVIGDSGVGKSCLTMKATKNHFEEGLNSTVGFEFYSFNMKIDDKIVKLQIWDTCGMEIYRSLITNFYRNSALALVMYSVDNENSFENTNLWLKELRNYSNPDIQIFLIGNKCDLEDERQVSKDKAEIYAKQQNTQLFLESSAKTGFNAQKVFVEAGRMLYKNYLLYSSKFGNSRSSSIESAPIDIYSKKIKMPQNAASEPNKDEINQKKSKGGCCK